MTMSVSTFHVAIIGAGLSGLALALALHQQSIDCTYTLRSSRAAVKHGGALMLTPNGLKVLKRLGIYEAVCAKGVSFDRIYFQDANSGTITEVFEYGSHERYRFRALRIYRSVLLHELLSKVQEKSIPIHFNHRFIEVTPEVATSVNFRFTNGIQASASLLVGADGIHSTVRSYDAPGLSPAFVSQAAIIAAIPTSQLSLPPSTLSDLTAESNNPPLPCGIVAPKLGAFVIAPQTCSGDEVMITVQRHMEPRAR